jgi:membrane protease YdiL (CAAX protease family)
VLKLWQAIVGVFVGFVGGQLAGGVGLVAGLVAMFAAAAAFDPAEVPGALARLQADPLGSPFVFIPMLAATGIVQTALALLVPALARVPVMRTLGIDRAPLAAMFLAPVGALALGPVSDLAASVFSEFLPRLSFGNLAAINEMAKRAPFIVMFVLMAVLPGLSEELLFRGLLQRAIRSAPVAIGVSGFAFAVAHLDPPHVVAVLPMGLFLGWVAWRTDSTWPTIAAHVANNGLAIAATRISALEVGQGTDTPLPWWLPPLGLTLGAACVLGISFATPKRGPRGA